MPSASTQLQVSSEFSQFDFDKAWNFIQRKEITEKTEIVTLSTGDFDIMLLIYDAISLFETWIMVAVFIQTNI